MVGKQTVDMIETKVCNLPLIDSAVVKIISLLNNPDSNFEQIVERLSPDLSARFLNIANSAHYGREVRSIRFAVKLLGYSAMKDILVTSILMDHFTKRLQGFNFGRFMRHAQFCTAVARVLGDILEFNRPDDLFTVASLQNIGKLVIAVYFSDEHKQIVALKKRNALSTREAEIKILGISHGEIGALVLNRFNIPTDICAAVKFHDTSDEVFPGETGSHLPYIAREASRIVSKFSLPEDINPSELITLLQKTIATGKSRCRQQVREAMRAKGYAEIFPGLLEQASHSVTEGLKQHLSERQP
jgi:HD-like signal output (HDOD) protein